MNRIRYAGAIIAGLVLAASFPNPGIAGLAWIAPALILLAAFGKPGKQVFRIGYVAGLAHYLASLYWLLLIPVPLAWAWAKVLGWLALGAFLALYPATWAWLCWKIFPVNLAADGAAGQIKNWPERFLSVPWAVLMGWGVGCTALGLAKLLMLIPVPFAWAWAKVLGWLALGAFLAPYPEAWAWLCWKIFPVNLADDAAEGEVKNWPERFLSVPWSARMGWGVACAALWVALEMTVARLLGGFPWNLLGDSQYQMTPLIQIAAYTGVYGVSFLVVWSSLSLLGAGMVIVSRPVMRSAWVGEIILPMAAVSALYLAGYEKLLRPEPVRPELTVALVQPSIPQTLIWDPAKSEQSFKELLLLSEEALTNKPDLLIWPESAVPGMVRWDRDIYRAITDLARDNKVWMIINSDDGDASPTETNYYNASFLISPEGALAGEYRKQHLVIFGEYVPLAKWLPFLKLLTPISGGYTPGDRAVPFELTDLNVKVSVLICFEDEFAQLARGYVDDDTDFLVNLTNDGWFGKGSAQRQQAAAALFRSVENGLPLVRCTNTGLTCWVDGSGRIRREFRSKGDGIYGAGFMIVRVPVLAPGERRAATFYHQHGDWFGWACVGFALVRVVASKRRNRTNEYADQPAAEDNA